MLVVKMSGREEGFGHSLLRFLPGLEIPAPLGFSKGKAGMSCMDTALSSPTGGTGAGWEQLLSEKDG